MSSHSNATKRLTVPEFSAMKQKGERIAMLTAYDFSMASLVDQAGIDGILVGDSMSMVVQGHDSTLPVTLDEMIYHANMVGRAVQRALVVVDMPFPSNYLGVHRAIENAGNILKRSQAQAVKLEGGADQSSVIAGLVAAGIPVMAHVGLRPQSVHQLGGYRVQRDAEQLMEDAVAAENAGAFSVVLECIPDAVATEISAKLRIPTIGIGAGPHCDGQILVFHDLLGLTPGKLPKHVKKYAELGETIRNAVAAYCEDVKQRQFPGPENSFQ
ncbi:MAG: 3-methyl-2-oxobutanoate hydroxymethyltransferase [Pirellulaceae bacterium]